MTAQSSDTRPSHRDWELWTTTAHIAVLSEDPAVIDRAEQAVREVTSQVEDACSRFRSDSEIMRRADQFVVGAAPSAMLATLIDHALNAATLTDGDVDPTLGNRMTSLGYGMSKSVPETPAADEWMLLPELDADGIAGAWRGIVLDDELLRIPAGVVLDLGATAKAAAADLAASAAAAATGIGVLVSLGGDIATSGEGPTGGWQVLVQDLPEDPAQIISLRSGWAMATSSTRRRRWERDGRPMHHILDPRWGLPAAPVWRSVSVAARSCVLANTWSTSAIVRGARATRDLEKRQLAARLVDSTGSVITTTDWPTP